MAVTKQTYTATATWTASGLAEIFRDAFIDAGLMAAWHNTFLSGSIENRVLAVAYDGAKTYGTTFYWFQFTTAGVFYANASAWNAASNIPAGTLYLDHFSTTTNATSNHNQFLSLSTSTTVTLTRYTSGNHSFFVLRAGANFYTFCIDHASVALQSWLDMDKGYHNGLVRASCAASVMGNILMEHPFRLRRSFIGGAELRGLTFGYNTPRTINNFGFGGALASNTTNFPGLTERGLYLPYASAESNANPAFGTDFVPVFTGIRVQAGHAALLPSDFGVMGARASNGWSIQDTVTVTAGVEVYEVIAFANGSGTTGHVSPLVLARTT
jgi:hypothetical protein